MKNLSEYCYRQVRDKSQNQCNCSSLISICRDSFLCCTCWKKHISILVLRCVKLCHCWIEALDFDTVRSKDGPCTWRMFLLQFNLFTSHCTECWVLNGLFALVTTCKLDIKRVKAKVYFTFYSYARDNVQCTWCKFRHQNITGVLPE